jgi:hypothetical protein
MNSLRSSYLLRKSKSLSFRGISTESVDPVAATASPARESTERDESYKEEAELSIRKLR